ncbi:MAG: haloalkane dehalogenase [Alphaproteobacteria bacterium]|nr:haloalkane dehalogenase [Alphaproteobacteria bacterium]
MALRTDPFPKQLAAVAGKRMAYVELGGGEPVFLFLHGNPTSSYLWRNVMPEVAGLGRCIAPDLIGMGDSGKLENPGPLTYRFAAHRDFLWRFIDAVIGVERPIVLVGHDWGSALAFDWANQHRERAAGIAYMEAIVRPLVWAEWPEPSRRVFQGFRSAAGEEMILDRNLFVERVLPGSVLRQLEPAEMDEYRRPFRTREDRWPTLAWPREIPIDGEPADVVALAAAYAEWMAQNQLPKLFVNAEPGAILTGALREFCRTWRNQTEATVRGSHFIQEDSGPEIGRAIAAWARALPRG